MTGRTTTPPEAQGTNKFADYAKAGFLSELLSIIPPGVAISRTSQHPRGVEAGRGKVPGLRRADGWVGFKNWPEHQVTAEDLTKWQSWGAGVSLRGRRFPALDIDVNEPDFADTVHALANKIFGTAPARFGRGPRRMLPYAGTGIAKSAISFRRPGSVELGGEASCAEGATTKDSEHTIELLGDGQQYVVEGVHPKTLKPYYWLDGRSPAVIGSAGLTTINAEQVEKFFSEVETLIKSQGYELVSQSSGRQGTNTVWQAGLLAPSISAIARALAAIENNVDYITWLKFCAAIKAAAGPEHERDAFEIWAEWSLTYGGNDLDVIEEKWDSLSAPYRVGWNFLQRYATEHGDGTFYGAAEEFDAVAPTPSPDELAEAKDGLPLTAMFNRFVWVQRVARVADLETGELLTREPFNVLNRHIGPPTDTKGCAWAVLTSSVPRLQMAQAITYRPGGAKFIDENLPGLTGRCVNMWKPTPVDLPSVTRFEDVAKWLDHVAFVLPVEQERETVLNWLAWIVQNPGEKPNWALVLGSTAEGIGKDLTLEPVRVALGAANVREIDADDLASGYSDYLAGTRLLIVEEMQMNERKAMMNRLKPLIAAPPYTLRVNVKFQPQYEIPNLIATIFFTNMENALAIGGKDRRYYVTWTESEPKADAYYTDLVKWFADGGAAHAARWLLDRDISGFSPKGRAPVTAAKTAMQRASRSLFDEVLEDATSNREGPFAHHLFTLDEVVAYLEARLGDRQRISPQKVSRALQRLGVVHLGRLSLGAQPSGTSAPYLKDAREHQVLGRTPHGFDNDSAAIRNAFWADRAADAQSHADMEAMFQ